jgi:cytochrome c553
MKKFCISTLSTIFVILASQLLLAQGDPAAGQAKSALCATCHGADGNSDLSINPKIAGQNFNYIIKQLRDYKSGERANATMSAMVAALSDQDMMDLAAWFSSQEVTLLGAELNSLELGEKIYRSGVRELSVAACSACHSPTGGGNGPAGFPSLSGQHPDYTLIQLKAFRAGERQNDSSAMMRSIVERLTDNELSALANYVSGLN